ncbi:MAG: adenylosuccinate lyase, partial [Clostridia bacterium]|nr:adenylosuccinate lyase [Clostridia bacterium]
MTDNSVYQNPLITRYASKAMAENFSDDKRFKLWRKLWIALAEAEMELGLKITSSQVDEMKKYAESINFELAEKFEREVRHDVMAHVKAFGSQAVTAMHIIHLGATSCFVDCN